jgi:hypothetical protein
VEGIKPKIFLVSSKLYSSLKWPSAKTILKTLLILSTTVCEFSLTSTCFPLLSNLQTRNIITAPSKSPISSEPIVFEEVVGWEKLPYTTMIKIANNISPAIQIIFLDFLIK